MRYPILSFFWKHIKPYKWHYAVMMIAPIVSSFYPFAYNYSIKLFLDAMASDIFLSYRSVLLPICIFLVAQFILDLVWRISNIAEWRSEPYVRRSILVNSYDYVQHHSYTFFQENFTGAVSSKLKGLLDGYDKFWSEIHHGTGNRLLGVIVNLGALTFVNFYLGLFVIVWCLIYIPVISSMSKKLNAYTFDETESRHKIVGKISDNITNIISLFSFATRKYELKALDKIIADDFMPKQIRVLKQDFKIQIVGGIFYLLLFSFILFYMINLRLTGAITIGDFAFVFGISIAVSEGIWRTTISMQDFSRGLGDFRSAITILNVPHRLVDRPAAKALRITSPSIVFNNIKFAYQNSVAVFDDLDLKIQAGEKIGLVGHSGAGKSSLVNLLLRYFQYDQGKILIDGQDIAHVTQESLRQNIAVIPQDTLLFHRSLMENIRYGRTDATDEEVIEAARKAHIHDYISQLPDGYKTYVGERGVKLSGGQRQRVAIARAILKDAPILILDEATSSLDSQTEKQIQESLNLLIEDKNKTVIAVAHRLSTLKHMDRIIVLDKGKIIEEGSHEELMSKPKSLYRLLWKLQEI